MSHDLTVFNTLRSNKFSSCAFVSSLTRIPERDVQESIGRLLSSRKIYQSVGGVPKRYSSSEEQESEKQARMQLKISRYVSKTQTPLPN